MTSIGRLFLLVKKLNEFRILSIRSEEIRNHGTFLKKEKKVAFIPGGIQVRIDSVLITILSTIENIFMSVWNNQTCQKRKQCNKKKETIKYLRNIIIRNIFVSEKI
jgi:hypothetical protein